MANGAFALVAVRGVGALVRLGRWWSGGRPLRRALLVTLLAVGVPAAAAQGAGAAGQDSEVASGFLPVFLAAYEAAEGAYSAALNTDLGRAPTPDDSLWRSAVDLAEAAVAVAGTAMAEVHEADAAARAQLHTALLDAYSLTARVYGSLGWHSRTNSYWNLYVTEGGQIQDRKSPPAGLAPESIAEYPTDTQFATTALSQLAFARYEVGDFASARDYYAALLELDPDHAEALRWLARMAFEEGDTAEAIEIWGRLVLVDPDDEGARFFLELSRERDEVGVEASEAYRAGIRAYEAGDLDAAFEQFGMALDHNRAFADAAVWAARSAFEAGRPAAALPYWQAALEAHPDDARSAWFLEVTRTQITWGVAAANDFYAGQSAYEQGDLELAKQLFLSASTHNPDYVDAWVWAARTSQEAGHAEEAMGLWHEVLRLDPDDARARWFIQLAQQQLAFGPEAGAAFERGMAAYQVGDVAGARSGFSAAVEVAPGFAAAWGQLGRVEFQVGAYQAAAAAYAKALELDPDNDEYEFFAAEARRLAGIPGNPNALPDLEHEPVPIPAPAPTPSQPSTPAPSTEILPLPPDGPGQ